jgi:hypothetical protein
MSEVMNKQLLLASLAIVAALALVGVVAVQVLGVQEAFADAKKTGCHPGKQSGNPGPEPSFFNSGGPDDKGPGKCAKIGNEN